MDLSEYDRTWGCINPTRIHHDLTLCRWPRHLSGTCILGIRKLASAMAISSREVCLLTACWVTMEAFRSWFLTGFPWLLMGYSALGTPFEGYLSWVGVFGVSALIALTSGGLLASLLDRRLITLIVPCILLVTGPILNEEFEPDEKPAYATRVALWQPVIAQTKKWNPEFRGRIVEQHVLMASPGCGCHHLA